MTNHAKLDEVLNSLLAESGLSEDGAPRAAKPAGPEHWLRRTMKTGPLPTLPPPSRR